MTGTGQSRAAVAPGRPADTRRETEGGCCWRAPCRVRTGGRPRRPTGRGPPWGGSAASVPRSMPSRSSAAVYTTRSACGPVDEADGVELHGDAIDEGGEHAGVGGGIVARAAARCGESLDDAREPPLAVAVVTGERVEQLGIARRLAPRVDPHEVVVARGRGEPVARAPRRVRRARRRSSSPSSSARTACVEGLGDELLAGGEVVPDEPVHHADLGGDVAERHPSEAVAGDEPERRRSRICSRRSAGSSRVAMPDRTLLSDWTMVGSLLSKWTTDVIAAVHADNERPRARSDTTVAG